MSEVRLIDANALKQDLELSKYIVPNDLNRLLNSEINRCIEAIDNAPTVEYPFYQEAYQTGYEEGKNERPQGEWGKWVISEIKCPNCFEYFDTDCYSKGELNKCPNCGAKMKGGAE